MAQGIGNFIDRVQIGNDEAHQIAIGSSAYGVCSSLGNTVEKVVSLPGFTLNPGTTIHIKFNNANLATNPTLNVNSTGAKPIFQYGNVPVGTNAETNGWQDGAILTLTYDGTGWVRDQGFNTNTNTWRGIQDNLTSDSTTDSLSAKQGKVLKGLIDAMDASTPAASGNATAFIDSITQTDGKITSITKKNIPTVSKDTAGLAPKGAAVSTQSTSTKFLREDGTWATPSYITNTDAKVTQTISSTENADYRILLSETADDTTRTEGARKDTDLTYNPSTNTLTIGTGILTATNYSGNAATATSVSRLQQTAITSLSSFTHATDLIYAAAGSSNSVTDKPSGVDAFGVLSYKTANGWYSQILTASDTSPGIYWRTGATLSGGWTKLLDSDNTSAGANNAATLTWGTTYTLAKINGTDIKFTTMAKPSYAFTDLTAHPTTLGDYGITDAKIASGVITLGSNTITPITSVNGHTGSSINVTAVDLGLSNAMHFIGVVANDSTNTPSDGSNSIPTITGLSSYTPAAGDVIIDKDNLREYVWSNDAWVLLGFTTSSIYNSDSIEASSSDEPTWISNIQQATDGKISIQRKTIGTLGVGHGGTGKSEWAQWGIIYASATNTLAQVTAGASTNINQPLISGGPAAPKWYAGLTLTGDGTQQSPYDATFNNTVTITGATTLSSTLSVAKNSTLTGKVGIGALPDNNYQLYVNGVSLFNGNTTVNGNLLPGANNTKTLGSTDARWAKLYIGNADSHGDAYTPIYWNNGVPAAVTLVQYCEFTIGSGKTGVKLTHAAFTAASYVTQIVVTNGESNLNSAIGWESAAGYINLTCGAVTSGAVSGYILVSRGGAVTATTTDIT